MKYQIGAAVAALAIALVSGSVTADPASSTVLATSFVMPTKILSGLDSNFAPQTLKHTVATTHQFAAIKKVPPDPCATGCSAINLVPPDPCRALALVWNVAVYQNRTQNMFDALLKVAAATSCTLQVTRASAPNADGSSDLVSVTVAPQ